jgi:hypothetical protein
MPVQIIDIRNLHVRAAEYLGELVRFSQESGAPHV